jgi:hypothetical protein
VSASKPTVESAPAEPAEPSTPQPRIHPLRPQRKLFIGLLAAFLLWVGVLVTMYFTLVFPERHSHPIVPPVATAPAE